MTELTAKLLGFIMAHSALIGDSLQPGELLVPYVIIENAGKREVLEFEAETQQIAVQNAENKLKSLIGSVDAWAYSQDGLITLDDGKKQDVFLIKVWVKGLKEPLQAYQMYAPHPFKLIGNVQILNYESSGLSLNEATQFERSLREGIHSHKNAAIKWNSWF